MTPHVESTLVFQLVESTVLSIKPVGFKLTQPAPPYCAPAVLYVALLKSADVKTEPISAKPKVSTVGETREWVNFSCSSTQ